MRSFDRNERNGCLPLMALTGLIIGSILLLLSLPQLLTPLAFILSFIFCSFLVQVYPNRTAVTTAGLMGTSLLWAMLILAFILVVSKEDEAPRWFRYLTVCFLSGLPAYWLYFFVTKGRPIKESIILISRRPKKSASKCPEQKD